MGAFASPALLATQAVGTGVQAFGAYREAQGQKQAAQFDAQVAGQNATFADRQATDAQARGQLEVDARRRDISQLRGQQRAGIAASGADVGAGSALDIQRDTSYLGDIDTAVIRQNADREAYASRQQAANFQSEASMSRARAKGISPGLAAGTTLLNGGEQFASSWYTAYGGRKATD